MAAAPAKLLTAAKHDKTNPQRIIHKAEYLASGSRCNRRLHKSAVRSIDLSNSAYLVGYSKARYPNKTVIREASNDDQVWYADTKVKEAAQPLILVADQTNVLLDAHDRGIRDGRFVEIVQSIYDAHDLFRLESVSHREYDMRGEHTGIKFQSILLNNRRFVASSSTST